MKLINFRNIMLFLAVGTLAGCDFMDCDESSDYSTALTVPKEW